MRKRDRCRHRWKHHVGGGHSGFFPHPDPKMKGFLIEGLSCPCGALRRRLVTRLESGKIIPHSGWQLQDRALGEKWKNEPLRRTA